MISKSWRTLSLIAVCNGVCSAQTFDVFGRSEVLGEPESDWIFIDYSLVDVVDNRFLGLIGVANTNEGAAIDFSPDGSSLFVLESFRPRGHRGERTDTLTVFDTGTLGVTGEVVIPPKRALMLAIAGATAVSDNDRFLAVFNMTPATSVSVVDLERLEFVGEIQTPGCSLVFAAGELRFVMLCANGGVLTVTVDENGHEVSRIRTEGFFDPLTDPVREGGVRFGGELLFVSFNGIVHSLDISGPEPRFGDTWSLLTQEDRAGNWRISGRQHLSIHHQTGRLYSLVRRSEEPLDDPADADGTEIWVYALQSRERLQRFEAIPEQVDAGGGGAAGIGSSSGDGASNILVTQGNDPLLVTAFGGISVRNALTGEYIHERLDNVPGTGWLTPRIQ